MDIRKREAMNATRTAFGADYEANLRKEAGPNPEKVARRKHQISSLYHQAKMKVRYITDPSCIPLLVCCPFYQWLDISAGKASSKGKMLCKANALYRSGMLVYNPSETPEHPRPNLYADCPQARVAQLL